MLKKLYKYRVWSDKYHKRALTHNEIYFSSASRFNDPYDCKIPLNFGLGNRKQHMQLAIDTLKVKRPELSENERNILAQQAIDKIFENPVVFVKKYKEIINQKWENDAGVYSLSSKPDSIVMWSHYCDKHNGFVIGYDYRELKKCRLLAKYTQNNLLFDIFKVYYVKEFPNFNPFIMDDQSMIIEPLRTKSYEWAYEHEFRMILISGTNKSIRLPSGIIREVILGYKMKPSTKNKIISKINKKNKNINVFETSLNDNKFELTLNPISV